MHNDSLHVSLMVFLSLRTFPLGFAGFARLAIINGTSKTNPGQKVMPPILYWLTVRLFAKSNKRTVLPKTVGL